MQGFMLKHSIVAAGILLFAAASPVAAHGTEAHAKKSKGAPKEQTAWGVAGEAADVVNTVEVRMADTMRFTPDRLTVRVGQTVRFVIANEGKLMHEFVIGTRPVLDEHAALMRRFPTMEHDEPYMAHVEPGHRDEVVWKFNRAGEFHFGCLVAGHYEAGMVGRITVVAD